MITYTTDIENVAAADLKGFFVGWPKPPSQETHLKVLQSATHIVLAIDDDTGHVVGFVNAISDGVLAAYMPLLEVLPEYQGRGIGKELMQKILKEIGDLYMIDLVCNEDLAKFYGPLGFSSYHAMMVRNFDCQAGRH